MTQGIFVGHHDRTGAVLCITKNGSCARQKLDKTDAMRCMGIDELGRFDVALRGKWWLQN